MTTDTQTTGLAGYYPEMGEARPDAQIEASLGHYGKHYFLNSQIKLAGRGVTFRGTLTEDQLVPGSRLLGWHQYKVTIKAFERICKDHKVASEFLL